MRRAVKLLAGIGLVLVLLIAAAAALVSSADWNRLKPALSERASLALGRPFAIEGELSVGWSRGSGEPGWRSLLPWIEVDAGDLRIGNPAWATTPQFAAFERVGFRLALLPLLRRELVIPHIEVRQPAVWLERRADGRTNWVFDQDEEPEATRWTLDIGAIGFDRGQLVVHDGIYDARLQVMIDPLGKAIPFRDIVGSEPQSQAGSDPPQDYVFGWQAKGRYRGQAVNGKGRIGGLLALRGAGKPFPLQADMAIGNTRIVVAGTLTDPRELAALDLQLRLSGANLADLYALTGLTLPDTAAYATEGRLSAELKEPDGAVYRYRGFNGRIGDSDIHGDLTYTASRPRPLLAGELRSRLLRFSDLAPLIGGGEHVSTQGPAQQQPDRILPAAPFRTERWRAMDADVRFAGRHVDRGEHLPFTDLQAHLKLVDGTLRLEPLRLGVAGGRIEGTVLLDGRRSPMQGQADLKARGLGLKQLFPGVEPLQTSLGELNGDAGLAGSGNSVAALLGSADGDLRLLIDDGRISRSLMEIAGLNVGSYIVTRLFGDEEVRINCVLGDFAVKEGLMSTQLFLFDTENARVDIGGTINLADERLDLVIRPQSKGLRLFSLRSPLYLRGSFKEPDAGVQPGQLLARGAGLLALGTAVAPAAGLLALVAPSAERTNPCLPLLEQMRAKRPAEPAR